MIGRFISGMSAGGFCVLAPIYIADIADKDSRDAMVTYFHLLINCGIMYAFLIAYALGERSSTWRYLLNIGHKDTKRLAEIYKVSYVAL